VTTPALGVDVGTVRVGLAGSDETGTIATPLRTVAREPAAQLWRALAEMIDSRPIGIERKRSITPRRRSSERPTAVWLARNVTDWTKIPGRRYST